MATVLPQLTVDVTGETSLMLAPERAVLSVEASCRTTNDADECTNRAIQAAREVEAILRQNSQNGIIDYWSRTSLEERSYKPYASEKMPEPATEYTSKISFEMHVQKFARLGGLIGELVAIDDVHSEGVKWVLTAETQNAQRSKLRAQAAQNAKQKAEEYAAALGYKDVWAFEAMEAAAYTVSLPEILCYIVCFLRHWLTCTVSVGQRSTNRKGGLGVEKRDDVATMAKNMAEEGWEDASEEAFQYSPEDVNMTQNVQVKFLAR